MEIQVIEKIQGRIDRTTGLQINRKLKVAAYARVRTDSEDQLNSFESQVKYYNEKITKNIEWSFVEVYADESISGTQDYKRSNFMRMIQDSMNGKIDLILTKSIMNKLIDLSLDNAIDRDTFLERKEKMQNQIEQLNLKQEKLVLDERNKTNRKLSLNKLKRYLENGEIITEFDKDAFEILVKQVIIGGYDEKDKADPKQVTFVLKNESKVNYEDYLQTSNDISQKNLQMSDHTCGMCNSIGVKVKNII